MCALPTAYLQTLHKIYAGSTELSPFHACYAHEDTVLRSCAGRLFVHDNGEDMVAAYWALRRKVAIYDVPERPIEIAGPDALRLLEKIFARRIAPLQIGRGCYVLACTHAGGLFMDGVLFRLEADRFWFVQPDGDMHTWLLAHNTEFDVTISDPKSRALQIQGPFSFRFMRAASDGAIDASMGCFYAGFFTIGGQQVYVSRTGWTGELGYEIYTQGECTNAIQLWDHLIEAGAEYDPLFSGMQSMNARRIEAGILDSGSDFDTSMTPFEAGLDKFIDLEKPGYIGAHALQKVDRQKRLFGVVCGARTPQRGDSILDGAQRVGTITTGAHSPFLKAGVGYVRFDEGGDWQGRNLFLVNIIGDLFPCEIVDPPFYDRQKAILKTITGPEDLP